MTEQEKENWSKIESLNLHVAREYFHHHAFEILNTHRQFKEMFLKSLNNPISIAPRIKSTKIGETRAIKADNLNIVIRDLLKKIPNNDIKFEVYEENGVFYFSSEKSSIGGFDFAILNQYNNILALRNLCFGNLQYSDGEDRWEKFLKKNPDLLHIANELKRIDVKGSNIPNENHQPIPLIVGEIQFGNWALAYRDFFKVLKADVQNSVDCLVYVVPTGNLERLLSDGIVTFDKTKKILDDFAKVISVPVWLIGLDVD